MYSEMINIYTLKARIHVWFEESLLHVYTCIGPLRYAEVVGLSKLYSSHIRISTSSSVIDLNHNIILQVY